MSFVSPSNTLNHWRDSAGSTFGVFETNRQSYPRSGTNVGCQTGVEDMSCAMDKNDATNRIVVTSQEKSLRFPADLPIGSSSSSTKQGRLRESYEVLKSFAKARKAF